MVFHIKLVFCLFYLWLLLLLHLINKIKEELLIAGIHSTSFWLSWLWIYIIYILIISILIGIIFYFAHVFGNLNPVTFLAVFFHCFS